MIKIFAIIFTFSSFAISNLALAHPYGPYKVGKPYKIEETQYVPAQVSVYKETGVASWYGNEFDGKITANGATFNSNLPTAAHRTLPMPCAVLITNLANNKQIVAIVNDRGPFSNEKERIIDVSKFVAQTLGFQEAGRANVTVEYIPHLSEKLKNNEEINIEQHNSVYHAVTSSDVKQARVTKVVNSVNVDAQIAAASTIGKTTFTQNYVKAFYVQVGVFEVITNAQKIYKHLAQVPKIQIRSETQDVKNYYIVRSGPFENITQAESSKATIKSLCKECEPMIVII